MHIYVIKIKVMMEKIICHSILVWMFFISICVGLSYKQTDLTDPTNQFYKIGPSDDLTILGFVISDWNKYLCVIGYCFINSIIRSLYHNILSPWITNCIQDKTRPIQSNIYWFAYESAYVITLYNWFDWFLYYDILLSQLDLLLVEISIDLVMSGIVTRYYLHCLSNFVNLENNIYQKCFDKESNQDLISPNELESNKIPNKIPNKIICIELQNKKTNSKQYWIDKNNNPYKLEQSIQDNNLFNICTEC